MQEYSAIKLYNEGKTSEIKDYFQLTKPGISSLVVFTTLTGMVIAPGHLNLFIAFLTLLSVYLGSGAAAAINMWYDRDIDILMQRTKKRPVAAGRIAAEDALSFGIILGFISILISCTFISYLVAMILLFCILFYGVFYTMFLKRYTTQNIVIGGLAGALPPMIGWAAVTNQLGLIPLLLTAIIFFWTPPHFWSLALYLNHDYQTIQLPMLPVWSGSKKTKVMIIFYTLLTVISSICLYIFSESGNLYLVGCLILDSIFLYKAIKLFFDKRPIASKQLFIFSIWYLFLLFTCLIIDHMI